MAKKLGKKQAYPTIVSDGMTLREHYIAEVIKSGTVPLPAEHGQGNGISGQDATQYALGVIRLADTVLEEAAK